MSKHTWNPSILIDDANWGCLLRGTLIGAYRVKTKEMMVGEVPVEYFQPPKFSLQEYLQVAANIAEDLLVKLKVKKTERITVCTGYVLRGIRKMLRDKGYRWRQGKIVGEFQDALERRAREYVQELGVSLKSTSGYGQSFITCLNWLKNGNLDGSVLPERQLHAKTGWPSYEIWANHPPKEAKILAQRLRNQRQDAHSHTEGENETHPALR